MSFTYTQKIPTPQEIISEMPLSEKLIQIKAKRDQAIKNIFTGKDNRFLLIIGPCSAHNEDAVCEYVEKLARIQEEVAEKIIIIPRVYTNKPRTTGEGYKGMMHQPDPAEKPNIVQGLIAIRKMHLRILNTTYLFPADEMLYPSNYPYLEDVLSYVAIGARSTENQQHRLTVSGLDIPAGMKNPTSGDIEVMLNSIQAGQQSHLFIYNSWEAKTSGNPLTHAILRGAQTSQGVSLPNYHYEDLVRITERYHERKLQHPAIIIDTNHANSGKQYKEQPRIAGEILHSRTFNPAIQKIVKGFMVESYLIEGCQSQHCTEYGKSITDPCLGWDDSEKMIKDIAYAL